MADTATTTSGNIYQNGDSANVVAAVKQAEFNLNNEAHHHKDYLSDKQTQSYIGLSAQSEHHTDRMDDSFRQLEQNGELRATRGVDQLLNESRFLDIGAARRADAITLAATNNASVAARDAAAIGLSIDKSQAVLSQQATEAANVARSESLWARDETRQAAQSQVLANHMIYNKVAEEGSATRALINQQTIDGLREKLNLQHQELVELRYDGKCRDRDFNNLNQNFLASQVTSQLNMLNSNLANYRQEATQGTVNFGTMSGNAGRNTSTNNVA